MRSQRGFTLIEILMVVMLVAILAAISIPQFIDFRVDAKNAATQSALGTMRTAIANQYVNSAARCATTAWPKVAQLVANDITAGTGAPCTAAQVPTTTDRNFVATAALPDNPWSGADAANKNAVAACSGAGCTDNTKNCSGNAYATTDGGWCYNEGNGKIRANSANSTGSEKENTF